MTDLLALVNAHYEGLQTQDMQLALSPFAADVAIELPSGPVAGVEGLRGVLEVFMTAFPAIRLTRRNTWVDGRTAVVELAFDGTQDGPFITEGGPVPPSGASVHFDLIDVFVQGEDKVIEHRAYWDNVALLSQLNLTPA